MNRRKAMSAVILLSFGLGGAADVSAQEYPTRPIRLMVPFAAGGGNDTLARVFGQKLSESLGQSVVVENRAGAGATLATSQVARAAPDGYTLVLSSIASHAVSPHLYKSVDYDPIKDFAPIAMLGIAPVIMAVNNNVPAKSVSEFIAAAKAKPGEFKFASGGVGSVMHTAGVAFSQAAGIQMLHVPFRGAGPAYISLLAGDVDLAIDTAAALMPYTSTGRFRGLAIARASRLPEAPDIPTFAEAGLPAFEANGWYSLHAPAGTPRAIIEKLNREIVRISELPDVRERLRQLGTETIPNNTPETLTQFVQSELEKYRRIMKDVAPAE
jgi:tripartite-type tricarboxylate transporter receptor subunit TctC